MLPELESHDWGEVFGYAGEPGHDRNSEGSAPLLSVPPGHPDDGKPQPPVLREDVVEIIGMRTGENDGANWLIAGRTRDGRFFYISAGCDYTGWDCRAGGHARVAPTREGLWRWAMTTEDRRALGLPEPEVGP